MTRYRWEPTSGVSGRYRDTHTGRYVAGQLVRNELDTYLANSDNAAGLLAQQLRDRGISLADWELAMRREIKRTHLNAIAMQRGGWANMTPSDYGRAGQIIREQYAYLRRFAQEIADGKRLDGTLNVRAKLYTQAGRTSYYKSLQANMKDGITMVMSRRTARDSCRGCIELDGKWFRLGDPRYRLPGQRECRSNCRCHEAYGYMTADGQIETAEVV